jgi:hypothetical protein
MSFEQKYLKYKNKYLSLKEQYGGQPYGRVVPFGPFGQSILEVRSLHELDAKLSDPSFSPEKVYDLKLRGINEELGNRLNRFTNLTDLDLGNHFNKPLGDSLKNLTKLRELRFRALAPDVSIFNQPLGNSLEGLKNLSKIVLSSEFNQPFGDSLKSLVNLETLEIGSVFNQPLGDSLKGLTSLRYLNIGGSFNQPLEESIKGLNVTVYRQ